MQEEKLISEKTHIRCKIIVEVLGKPKEHVEKTIRMYVDKVKNDSDVIVLKTDFSKAEEKEKLWAIFAEMEIVVKGIKKLIAFCFDYMPSSIQILKPNEFMLNRYSIENFLNDLQARLHEVDMIVKKQKNENIFLKKNMHTTVKNLILLALASGSLSKEKISKITGIHGDELKVFLEKLIEEKNIREENDIYSLDKK